MALPRPVVLTTVDDPRALGRIDDQAHGWGGDFLSDIPDWQHAGTQPIPSLKAIGPRGYLDPQNMVLGTGAGQWTITQEKTGDSTSWNDDAMPGRWPRITYLHMYDGTANAMGQVTSNSNFAPRWCACIYRYLPRSDTTLPTCDFSIKMHGLGTGYPSWRIVVPTQGETAKYPYLIFDAFSTGQGKRVSYFDGDLTSGVDSAFQRWIIWCELTQNQWIIALSVNGNGINTWTYTPPGTDVANPHLHDAATNETAICGDGKITVRTQGQQIMAAVMPIYYPLFSEAYLKTAFPLAAALGDVDRATDPPFTSAICLQPTGTLVDVTCDVDGATNAVSPRLQFGYDSSYTAGANTKRAIVGVTSVVMDAVIEAATHAPSPWVSTGKTALGPITYTRRSTWKGNSMTAAFRDAAAAATWKGNEVVTLEAGYQTVAGTSPTLRKLLTAYLKAPKRERDSGGGLRGELKAVIEASDFAGSRMERRTCAFWPSLGSFDFNTAVHLVGNRLGFLDANIVCSDAVGTLTLPYNQIIGDPALAYGATDRPADVLDAICKIMGRVWGINASGQLFTSAPPAYGGTPDFVLDSDTTTEADIIRYFESERDMAEFANSVYSITGPEGFRQFGWAQDTASQDTDTADDFVGDPLQFAEIIEKAWAAAATLATATLARRATFSHQLLWRPIKAQALDPGMFVKAQLDTSDVPTDSVFLLVEEVGEFDPLPGNQFGWKQTWKGVRVA